MQTFCSIVIRNAFANTKPSFTEFNGKCHFTVIWGGFKYCQKVKCPIFKYDVPFVWQNMINLFKFRMCEMDVYHTLHTWCLIAIGRVMRPSTCSLTKNVLIFWRRVKPNVWLSTMWSRCTNGFCQHLKRK